MRTRRLLAGLAVVAALGCATDAGWITAKAALAQVLLERSWQQARADGVAPAPWPWADTRPVARLRAPGLGIEQYVLAGDNGRTLAFGPGWSEASALPGSPGLSVVSGHRDTHFAWLQHLQAGDGIELDTGAGLRRFRVEAMEVVDARHQRIALDPGRDALALVTCWPFDAVAAGGPLRYVVTARALDAASANANANANEGSAQPRAASTAERIRAITSA